MFGSRHSSSMRSLLSVMVLLFAARGTLQQEKGGHSDEPSFSDFFSSINLHNLEDDIVLTDKLLERLDLLQGLGQNNSAPSDFKENVATIEEVFSPVRKIGDKVIEKEWETPPSKQVFSKDSIAAQRESLKKYLWKHPFKFIGLLFSDLSVPNPDTTGFDGDLATDLTAFLGLKLMFKFVLKIFGVDSEIGRYVIRVSDEMRKGEGLLVQDSELQTPLQWIGLGDSSSSLVTTKENKFGVSEVEAKVSKAIISLMAAVSEISPHHSFKGKLSAILISMKDIVKPVKEFLRKLKYEVFPAELKNLNNARESSLPINSDNLQLVKPGTGLHKKGGQYPDFYAQFLRGEMPTFARKKFTTNEFGDELFPAPPIYKSIQKRDDLKQNFANDSAEFEDPQKLSTKKLGAGWVKELFILTRDDARLTSPTYKWNILRKLFNNQKLSGFGNHHYNYFVDEGSLLGRLKDLRTRLDEKKKLSPSSDSEALVTANKAFTNLEMLLTDVYGVRKAAITYDPSGVEDFGNVFFNAETLLDEIMNLSRTKDFSSKAPKLLDPISEELLKQAFA